MADPWGAEGIGQCVAHPVLTYSLTDSLSKCLLSACDVPGPVLGSRDTAENKAKSLSSWDLYSSRQMVNKKINK